MPPLVHGSDGLYEGDRELVVGGEGVNVVGGVRGVS